jgi:adenosylcobinamide-GDP ribazoletransferase
VNALLRALALFTITPVRVPAALTRADAAAALRWFPVVGAAMGALAGLPIAAIRQWAPHAGLLGAVLAVGVLALASRALHLDGLADTADALGSRADAGRALEIMRRPDIGPFGVVAVVLVLLVDVAALDTLGGGTWRPMAALAVACATGRLAALGAAHRRVPPARADGFGAYVAGSASGVLVAVEAVAVLGFGLAMAAATGAALLGWPVGQLAALAVAAAVAAHVARRVGGVTGDVFGALVEITTAATLAGLSLS